jgi:hypothetical protein
MMSVKIRQQGPGRVRQGILHSVGLRMLHSVHPVDVVIVITRYNILPYTEDRAQDAENSVSAQSVAGCSMTD